ncbi:hypothetical protein Tco_0274621, partial [Tanacetum coccineum]
DRPYYRHTALALDREAVYARIAWTSSEERSAAIEAHVRTLEAEVATLIAQATSLWSHYYKDLDALHFGNICYVLKSLRFMDEHLYFSWMNYLSFGLL